MLSQRKFSKDAQILVPFTSNVVSLKTTSLRLEMVHLYCGTVFDCHLTTSNQSTFGKDKTSD